MKLNEKFFKKISQIKFETEMAQGNFADTCEDSR